MVKRDKPGRKTGPRWWGMWPPRAAKRAQARWPLRQPAWHAGRKFLYDGPLYTRAEALGFAISDLRRSRPPKGQRAARRFVDAQIRLLEAAKARVEATTLTIDWGRVPYERMDQELDHPVVASVGEDGIMGGTK